jgi:hypothetical protein
VTDHTIAILDVAAVVLTYAAIAAQVIWARKGKR